MTAPLKILHAFPIFENFLINTLGPIIVSSPISTLFSIIEKGPIEIFFPKLTSLSKIAVG